MIPKAPPSLKMHGALAEGLTLFTAIPGTLALYDGKLSFTDTQTFAQVFEWPVESIQKVTFRGDFSMVLVTPELKHIFYPYEPHIPPLKSGPLRSVLTTLDFLSAPVPAMNTILTNENAAKAKRWQKIFKAYGIPTSHVPLYLKRMYFLTTWRGLPLSLGLAIVATVVFFAVVLAWMAITGITPQ